MARLLLSLLILAVVCPAWCSPVAAAPVSHPAPKHRHAKKIAPKSQLKAQAPQMDMVPPEPSPAPTAKPVDALNSSSSSRSSSKADSRLSAADILRYGTRKHALGELTEAEAAFKHVLTIDPKNVDAFFDLGAMAEQRGDYFTALSDYRAALALHPEEKQLKEAVNAMEVALTNSGKLQGMPPFAFSQPRPVLPTDLGAEPQLVADPQLTVTPGRQSQSISAAASASDPQPYQQDGIFQLSSNRTDLLGATNTNPPPNLSVGQPPSFAGNASLPSSPVPAMPVNQGSRFRSAAGAVLSTGLNAGLGLGLRASGLHCPVCHMLRFRF